MEEVHHWTIEIATLDNNSDDNADLIQKKSKRKLKQSKNERQRQEKG
jgi:hypothetical protein